MTTIAEEPEALQALDFSQLLDLDQTAFSGSNDLLGGFTSTAEPPQGVCPSHPGADDCLCHGLMGDWDIPVPDAAPFGGLDEPDYSKFENWIPRFIRPEKPCDYCKSKRLNCYLRRGEARCTPCLSLFRECSLTNSNTLEASNYFDTTTGTGTYLDTLHAVDENAVREQGTLTGIKPLRSKDRASGTSTPVRLDDAPGSSKRNGIRFPRHAVKILRDWLDEHSDHPYPTEDQKADLERRTELKPSQIANWLANARRRRKVAEKPRPKVLESPSLRASTPAISIPAADKPWDELNPLERWKHSPPDHEPANISDIFNAVAHSDLREDITPSPSSGRRKRSSNGSGFSSFRAPSTTSVETSTGHSSSLSSASAALSHRSSQSHGSFGSFNSSLAGKRDRRRRRRPTHTTSRKPSDGKQRIFQCTFCTDTFKAKYDWTRHEKSLHLSLEKWICHPLGPVVVTDSANNKKCVFCDLPEPSDEHIETHNHKQCEDKGIDARTFYRKDHLRQHLRLMHGCEMTKYMELWKSTAVNINSRCGFCAQRFTVWQERVDHLTAHFKAGARMSQWKGCRGLDPAVAAQVTNAMPPYLIGIESVSPNPFSATNRATWRQDLTLEKGDVPLDVPLAGDLSGRTFEPSIDNGGYGSKATCWEILTVRLGKYANEMAQQGIVLSDKMLQQQAIRILFDSDDSWNQTAADNPEWLDLFKKAHGLDFIPTAVGGTGMHVPEDLETYGDLGLRIPFAVQLQAYNLSLEDDKTASTSSVPAAFQEALSERRTQFRETYAQLHREGKLHGEDFDCGHAECKRNVADITWLDYSNMSEPRLRRWCNLDVPAGFIKPWSMSQSSQAEQNKHIGLQSLIGVEERLKLARSRHEARAKGLNTLAQVETAEICNCDEPASASSNPATDRAQARALSLARLAKAESDHCTFDDCMRLTVEDAIRLGTNNAATSRARSLEALSRAEAPVRGNGIQSPPVGKKPYLQRHRYELPRDRAQRFEKTTGAWQDSGMMPEPVHVTSHSEHHTTTGAMMEFLGGDIGSTLPFSGDAATSTIPLSTASGSNWPAVEGVPLPNDQLVMRDLDLDELIAATSAFPEQPGSFAAAAAPPPNDGWPVSSADWFGGGMQTTNTQPADLVGDMAMEDFNFEDMTFDDDFNVPLDDMMSHHGMQ